MSFEFVPILLILSAITFVTQFVDSGLGLGFGMTTTPILLILGYQPSEIVPGLLLTNLGAGIVVTIFHKILKNLELGIQNQEEKGEGEKEIVKEEGEREEFTKRKNKKEKTFTMEESANNGKWWELVANWIGNLTDDSKVIIVLSSFAVIGTITSGVLSVVFEYSDAFTFGVEIYIGVMLFVIGIVLLVLRKKRLKPTWPKIVSLGVVAGFNKGISGGGYGPLTVSGQILSGRNEKHAIASTLFSETIAAFIGVITYILTHVFVSLGQNNPISWEYLYLAPYLLIGAVLAAPIAAFTTNKLKSKWLEIAVGGMTIFLGLLTLVRITLLHFGVWKAIPRFVEMFS
ncbi:MAG: TSUP family transporter [Candidatus Heimdallarchaeota archaeon]|nr:TSUP family transporter [Candidatus Heimdallarchaeota archaeon]